MYLPLFFKFIPVLLLVPGNIHAAEVYRCPQENGRISFQQQACQTGGERIETGEVQSGWVALRKGEKSLYDSYRQHDRNQLERKKAALTKNRNRAKQADKRTCWKKQKQLDAVSSRLRAGYKPSQGEALRRRRDYYEEYLRNFCP
jgi:hypothetical protein